jgi:hypothetical protein
MIKSGSLVRWKHWKNDHIFGIDSKKKMVEITKNDSLMFLEEIRVESSEPCVNLVRILIGSGIIVTLLANAYDFEVLEAVK